MTLKKYPPSFRIDLKLCASPRGARGIAKSPHEGLAYLLDQTHDLFGYRQEMRRRYMTNVYISGKTKNVSFACVDGENGGQKTRSELRLMNNRCTE
jgi:hypothetical protein